MTAPAFLNERFLEAGVLVDLLIFLEPHQAMKPNQFGPYALLIRLARRMAGHGQEP